MKTRVLVSFLLLGTLFGCTQRWVVLAENPQTKFFLDTASPVPGSGGSWTVVERFLDASTDRWYLEATVQYDCEARTFMTKSLREFIEQRPARRASEMAGNFPSRVVPGSDEEARLEAICEFVGG